jgi:hypothetical protein
MVNVYRLGVRASSLVHERHSHSRAGDRALRFEREEARRRGWTARGDGHANAVVSTEKFTGGLTNILCADSFRSG